MFCTLVFGLACAAPSHAANLIINDGTPSKLTLVYDGFLTIADGQVTVSSESVNFSAQWTATTSSSSTEGVIYIVDRGQQDLIRARITGTWDDGTLSPSIYLTVDSTAFGDDLGLLPPEFAGMGIPMPHETINIQDAFRDPITAAPVSVPDNLTIQYVGDVFPEATFPLLFSALPNRSNAFSSDLDANGGANYESAESITFEYDVLIQQMHWWGSYLHARTLQADADDFIVRIYEDADGMPAAYPMTTLHLPNAIRVGTGRTNRHDPTIFEFFYTAKISHPILLESDRTYWIAIVNNTANDTDDGWYWADSGFGQFMGRKPPGSGEWASYGWDLSFEFFGRLAPSECPADINGDQLVDGPDLAALLARWGPCAPAMPLVAPSEHTEWLDESPTPRGTFDPSGPAAR